MLALVALGAVTVATRRATLFQILGIVLVLGITGMHEILLRRLERKVAAYRQS